MYQVLKRIFKNDEQLETLNKENFKQKINEYTR